MATSVLMNDSPAPHRPRNVSLVTPNTGPSASGVQPHNTSGSRMIPEEAVDRLLEKAKSPLGVTELRKVVEALEKVSGRHLLPFVSAYQTSRLQMLQPQIQVTLRMRRRCFRGLVKICGEYGILPTSYIIPESKIKKLGDSPIASGGFSEVSQGVYDGDKSVAIKVIQLYTLNIQGPKGIKEVKKVRHLDPLSSSRSDLIVLRTSAERS